MTSAITGRRLGAVGIALALAGTTLFGIVSDRSFVEEKTSLHAVNPDAVSAKDVREAYGRLVLSFEANLGQTDARVNFLSRGRGYTLFLTSDDAVLMLGGAAPLTRGELTAAQTGRNAALRMSVVGSDPHSALLGQEKLPGIA